jgi:hypothetical protein
MSDDENTKSWWQTLPGVITGLAAVITALAALVAAIHETGWLSGHSSSPTAKPAAPVAPSQKQEPVATSQSLPPHASRSVTLPAMRDYKLGGQGGQATFTLLGAEVSARTAEKDELRIRLRMTNHGRYDANFWVQSFRLIVDDAVMAPDNDLDELVPGQSTKEGEVVFVLARGATAAKLKITHGGDGTEIPLNL